MAYDDIKQLSSVRPTQPVSVRPRHVRRGPKKKRQGQNRDRNRDNDKDRLTLKGLEETFDLTEQIDTKSSLEPRSSRKKIDIRV